MTQLIGKNTKLHKSSLMIVFSQICNMGVSFVIVPITLNILGAKNYGVWITLMAMIEWLTLFDFGFGHSLRNKFAEAKAKNEFEDLKSYVSTTFFVLLSISLVILIVLLPLNSFVDWSKILNATHILKNDLGILASILCIIFCIRFVTNIISTILIADQLPFIPAFIALGSNLLSMIGLLMFKNYFNNSILTVGLCLSITQVIPLVATFFILFTTKYKSIRPKIKYFSKLHLVEIFNLGSKFFLIQITNLVLYYSNNIIIAHSVGNEEVTEFNLAYRYINIINIVFLAFLTPYWSSFTDAYTRGEFEWIRKTMKRINIVWLAITLMGVIVVFVSPFVYSIWVGEKIIPDIKLLFLILAYFIFTMRYTIYRTFMNGVGKIKLQFYITSIEALLHVPLAILLSSLLGVYGAVITMVIWSFINSIWEPIQYKKIITNKALGLWGH